MAKNLFVALSITYRHGDTGSQKGRSNRSSGGSTSDFIAQQRDERSLWRTET